MNKLTFFLINRFSTGKTDHNNMQNILLKALIPGVLALSAYSSTSLADYKIWYDSENFQEHQIYNGNTLLVPPDWACGRKFSMPSYYRHLDVYHNTLDSADFWKDIYVWIEKPGCPYTNTSFIEYIDGSQTFSPPLGAIAIEISTNYSSRWVDENGSWPVCNDCAGPTEYGTKTHEWENIFGSIATLKKSVFKKDFVTFNDAVIRTKKLLVSLENDMNDRIQEADFSRSKDDKYRLATVEGAALNHLSMARKQLEQCESLANNPRTVDSAYPSCDFMLENLQQSQSLWRSRN